MKYISTRNNSKEHTFEQVFIKGLASDGGLFIPKSLEKFSTEELNSMSKLSYQELAEKILSPFIGNFMTKDELFEAIKKSYSVFRKDNVVNIIKIDDTNLLELFHGPTLAFKDIAMQLLGNFYNHFLNRNNN